MTRLTSPPDAMRASGRACMPAPGRNRNSTARGPRARPRRPLERRHGAHQLGAAHLQAVPSGHTPPRRSAAPPAGAPRPARARPPPRPPPPRRARCCAALLARGRVVHQRHEVGRLGAAGQHVFHPRPPRPQRAPAGRPCAPAGGPGLPGRTPPRRGTRASRAPCLPGRSRPRAGRRAHSPSRASRRAAPSSAATAPPTASSAPDSPARASWAASAAEGQRLGVLHLRQVRRQLLVLPLARVHRVDAARARSAPRPAWRTRPPTRRARAPAPPPPAAAASKALLVRPAARASRLARPPTRPDRLHVARRAS